MFGLVDCNSFFASCELIFRPDLRGKPVVVLSSNDGCVVALTPEAKAVGLRRGNPLFQISDIVKKHGVAVFSSNYELYADISSRVMSVIAEEAGHIDIYSIDEAFIDIDADDALQAVDKMRRLRQLIMKGVGIPVSIGIAHTRTLAKVANHYAKAYPNYRGVCSIDSEEKRVKALKLFPVDEVWGVGRRNMKVMQYNGIRTAYGFTQMSEAWVKANFQLQGVRTWKELRGVPCKDLTDMSEKKSICVSRSFGSMISDYSQMAESVANFASSCAEKLRRQHSVASCITVFIHTNSHREDLQQYGNTRTVCMPVPTSYTGEIVTYALAALKLIFRPGYMYKKSGVVLSGISDDSGIQQSLFDGVDRSKMSRITKAVDSINRAYGHDTVHLAIQRGSESEWNARREYRSPHYTTDFEDLMTVVSG